MQAKKPMLIFSVSTLQKYCIGVKTALMSAFSTNCKLSTEAVSVSDVFISARYLWSRKSRSPELPCFTMCCQEKEREVRFPASL